MEKGFLPSKISILQCERPPHTSSNEKAAIRSSTYSLEQTAMMIGRVKYEQATIESA